MNNEKETMQEIITWFPASQKPSLGDEYIVHYELHDGDKPVSTMMLYDALEEKWTDPQSVPDLRQNENILFWAEIPDMSKPSQSREAEMIKWIKRLSKIMQNQDFGKHDLKNEIIALKAKLGIS